MLRLLLLLLALTPFITQAQQNQNPIGDFNSEAFWKKVRLEKHLPAREITEADTTIIVISNRKPANDELRYMSEDRDEEQLHYFFVYTGNGIWHALQVASLEQAIQYEPKKNTDWVVYTEGMGKLFTSDIARGIGLAGQYKVNVLLLDYPSISTKRKSIGNYFFAIKNARNNYKDFAPALAHVKQLRDDKKMGTGKLTLFFHSMGNNLQRSLVRHNKLAPLNNEVWVDNLVLNAPCVPRRHTKKWMSNIHYAQHTYVHYNPNDFTLSGAYFVSKLQQLGNKPLRHTYTDTHTSYINFSLLCGKGHSNFLSIPGREPAKPAAIKHYETVLHGNQVNLQDGKLYLPTTYKKVGWDILALP